MLNRDYDPRWDVALWWVNAQSWVIPYLMFRAPDPSNPAQGIKNGDRHVYRSVNYAIAVPSNPFSNCVFSSGSLGGRSPLHRAHTCIHTLAQKKHTLCDMKSSNCSIRKKAMSGNLSSSNGGSLEDVKTLQRLMVQFY